MIPIIIEPDSLPFDAASNQGMFEKVLDSVVKDITASFAREWENTAKGLLHQTRGRYLNNLSVIDSGRMEGAVVLDYTKDPLIRMIEEGASAFDLKDGFEKSPKKKLKANGGWYLTIPFRQATPGAVAEDSVFSNKMPQDVYEVIKSKKANIDIPGGGKRSVGLKLGEIPEEYRTPVANATNDIPESKAFKSIYEGIIKIEDPVTKQNLYMSFRRASDASDPSTWQHPGIDEYDIAGKAMNNFEQDIEFELNAATNKILDLLGF